jgi:hypothetical protein
MNLRNFLTWIAFSLCSLSSLAQVNSGVCDQLRKLFQESNGKKMRLELPYSDADTLKARASAWGKAIDTLTVVHWSTINLYVVMNASFFTLVGVMAIQDYMADKGHISWTQYNSVLCALLSLKIENKRVLDILYWFGSYTQGKLTPQDLKNFLLSEEWMKFLKENISELEPLMQELKILSFHDLWKIIVPRYFPAVKFEPIKKESLQLEPSVEKLESSLVPLNPSIEKPNTSPSSDGSSPTSQSHKTSEPSQRAFSYTKHTPNGMSSYYTIDFDGEKKAKMDEQTFKNISDKKFKQFMKDSMEKRKEELTFDLLCKLYEEYYRQPLLNSK